jgi:hypothetical protein
MTLRAFSVYLSNMVPRWRFRRASVYTDTPRTVFRSEQAGAADRVSAAPAPLARAGASK